MAAKIPEVDHVSGFGMLLGLEIVKNPETREGFSHDALAALQDGALAKGLYIRMAAFGSRIMFCPPLVSTKAEIDRMVTILFDALANSSWRDQ